MNKTKFCMLIIIDKIYIGIVDVFFLHICNSVMDLDSFKGQVRMPPGKMFITC